MPVTALARARSVWRPAPPRNLRALAVTAAAAIVVSTVFAVFNGRCLNLVVASSNEKFQLLTEIAKTYRPPSVDRHCVTVEIIQKASGAAERSLRHDWVGESSSLPRPDVWSPAATTWLLLLNQHRLDDGRDELVPPVAQSIMQSPLVIVVHAIALVGLLFHSITWFNLAPQAMVIKIGDKNIPGVVITLMNYIGWVVISVGLIWLLASP